MAVNSSDLRCEPAQYVSVEPTAPGQHLVMLMSDDPLLLRALTRLLRNAGYDVVVGDSASGTGETAESRHPALVIVDVPDREATRAADPSYRALRRMELACVLWIGETGEAVRRHDDYLAKPFTGSQFLSKVAALLNN